MNDMQQRVYQPPNVAGWEGGMSWFNTNTVQGRFEMIVRAQYLKYSNYYATGADDRDYPAQDVNPETRAGRRASARGRPSTARGSRTRRGTALIAWAGSTPATDLDAANERRQRFYALQAMILGGPDGQVM